MIANAKAVLSKPVSDRAIRRGRVAVGAVAVAGGAAVLLGWGGAAEAKGAATGSYTIRSGDTLSSIAARHGVSVNALARANGLSAKSLIKPGQALTIPTRQSAGAKAGAQTSSGYVVRRGDTLSSIAARHGVSVATLASSNGLSSRSVLSVGRQLTIPGGRSSGSVAPKTGAQSTSKLRPGGPNDVKPGDSRYALKSEFRKAAAKYGVSLSVLQAMTWNESGWQNHVRSGVGARGIGQIMPGTAQHINKTLSKGTKLDAGKPADNIAMSAIYLRYLLDESHGDYQMALAAYYQGLASVRSNGLYDDTKQYVRTINALQRNYF